MRTHSSSELAHINGDNGQGKDVRVPEWLMTRLSFGLESSGSPDITVQMGKVVTSERREPPLVNGVWPCLHIRLRNFTPQESQTLIYTVTTIQIQALLD